jgi:hypothetical protein
MAERAKTKAERRQEAGHAAKAERKQAKLRRKQRGAAQAAEPAPATDGPAVEGIESRLASLEKAVAAQSELSERLLQKLDEVLQEARNRSA